MKHIRISNKITSRDSAELITYLKDISKYPVLTPEEEVTLVKQIKEGDEKTKEKAKEKLINSNLKFVVSVAKQFQKESITLKLGDLINAGNIGLSKAIQKYDETRGFKFITYAVWWIRQAIQEEISLYGYTTVSNHRHNLFSARINRFSEKFLQLKEREPTIEEIAEGLNEDVTRIEEILQINHIVRIDEVHEDGDPIFELISGNYDKSFEEIQSEEFLKKNVQSLLQCLSPTEKFIVEQYIGLNSLGVRSTFDSIAVSLGLGAKHDVQIKNWYKKALKKLLKEINKRRKNKAGLI